MKVCKKCGIEISTKDGENTCVSCNEFVDHIPGRAWDKKEREQALRDCGLVKVRGAMGGVYWE